jgi:hypothetical protein
MTVTIWPAQATAPCCKAHSPDPLDRVGGRVRWRHGAVAFGFLNMPHGLLLVPSSVTSIP